VERALTFKFSDAHCSLQIKSDLPRALGPKPFEEEKEDRTGFSDRYLRAKYSFPKRAYATFEDPNKQANKPVSRAALLVDQPQTILIAMSPTFVPWKK
jgi:hypothetical protein